MKKAIMDFSAFLFLSIALVSLAGCGKEDAVIDLKQENVLNDPQLTTYDELNDESNDESVNTDDSLVIPQEVTVYVCGAVNHAGVYSLKGSPRVVDAVEAAGGMNDQADTDYINQAMLLSDGQKVYIPTREETEKAVNDLPGSDQGSFCDNGIQDPDAGKVNINTADAAQLMTLPGIGEAKAALIIEYRTNSGRFDSIEDIMKISGIKEGMFNRIKDKICI